ncbi:SusC/RagA family TonB-linked outer membrane protein [Elizabethkingia bruuniana]|uniref:SusC/RagA family TonB-linked outer membrane protein n=1 Tax=Elizabethkingia bruuniana TaxID=1756149 RepID=UPI0009D5E8DB|nr:SusC/RagA family TonB-linked outer membrane protein [Elizabethkingia bruuniana]OPC52481.1 SusC/RagA family TonB-linked outer membrane protein [Elizabethkingia bruuniana]OPC60367.1 SusC/RagA family TonB-linked outer membrane protein [Elizabethkingia bruuniana]
MKIKLHMLSAGVLFFIGQGLLAQKKKPDTAKVKHIAEVIVLGYNKRLSKPKDVSANTVVTAERLEDRPNISFLNSLQGSTPGLTIASNSGSPGSAKIDVIIRGISSISASTEPLVILDGVPTNANQFRNLNSEDIESVTVLKDAAATSIYGNRGANGVLLIRTKSGKYNAPLKVSYSTTTGISSLPKHSYNLANASQFLTIQKRLGLNPALGMTDDEIANYPINTDWRKVFFKQDLTMQHNLQLSGGGENVNGYASVGYLEQGGMVPNTDFKRMTMRTNLNGKSKDNKLTFSTQAAVGFSRRNQLNQEDNSGLNSNAIQNPLLGSLGGLPYLESGKYKTGQELLDAIGSNFSGGRDIYVLEDNIRKGYLSMFNRYEEINTFLNGSINYKITDNITISNTTGADYRVSNRFTGRAPWGYLALVVARNSNTQYGGNETQQNTRELNLNSVTKALFNKIWGRHSLDLGAYLEYTKVHYFSTSQTQNGLNPKTWALGAGSGYVPYNAADPNKYIPGVSSGKINAGALSYFGTLDYDFGEKYGLGAVVRRDGSYRFTKENRWGTFWSVAGRWNIDKESFMEGAGFGMLKLRASYGTQGNQNIVGAAGGNNALLLSPNIIYDLNSATNGYDNNVGISVSNIANKTLVWEEITQLNVGLDFSVFKNKLDGNIDFYEKKTSQLYNDLRSSAITGFYTYKGNFGDLKNTGFEVALNYKIIDNGNTKIALFANASWNKNKLTRLEVPVRSGSLLMEEGGPLSQWNLVPWLGVNIENGNGQYLAADGSITERPTDADRRKKNNNFFPAYVGGFGIKASHKGFFLDTFFTFQAGFYRSDNQLVWAMNPSYAASGTNVSAELLNAWTPQNKNTSIPALKAPDYSAISDRFLFDASFIRLKSVMIGYNLPKDYLDKGFVKSLKIFLQGENLAVFTKWKGFDPEGLGTYPLSIYPNPKIVSIGASIDF